MNAFFARYAPYVYAILRIVVGLMFALHGCQKLFGFPPADMPMHLNAFMATGAIIELVGGLLVAVGWFGGYAAFLASGEMAVAYFMFHFPHVFHSPVKFFPILNGGNGGEPAILYCFIFLYIAARGSGVWSVDALLGISKTRFASQIRSPFGRRVHTG
jgi:putative oxidoreductase